MWEAGLENGVHEGFTAMCVGSAESSSEFMVLLGHLLSEEVSRWSHLHHYRWSRSPACISLTNLPDTPGGNVPTTFLRLNTKSSAWFKDTEMPFLHYFQGNCFIYLSV